MLKTINVFFTTAIIAAFVFCGVILGLIPMLGFPSLGINLTMIGWAEDVADSSIFDYIGSNTLYPYGQLINEGFGILILARFFINLGVSGFGSISLTYFLFYTCSFLSLIILLRRITNNKVITVLMTTIYFVSPFLIVQSGIPFMFIGTMAIPLCAIGDYIIYETYYNNDGGNNERKNRDIFVVIAIIIIRLIIASIGWYTAIISAVASGLFFLIYSVTTFNKTNIFLLIKQYLVLIFLPWVIGMAIIYSVTPETASSFKFGLDCFNSNAVDLVTVLFPTSNQAISTLLPPIDLFVGKRSTLTGDGTMWCNYLGYTLVASVLIMLRKKEYRNKTVVSLIGVALFTLILSLGPGIKFLETVPLETFPNYSLSLDAVIDTPWKFIYNFFPISAMRATYRWIVIPKFILIIIASYIFANLYKKGKNMQVAIILLCIICLIEFMPSHNVLAYTSNIIHMQKDLKQDTIDELESIITKKNAVTAICFYDYGTNGYMVPYLASELNIQTYAGAGDKALDIAKEYVPDDVDKLQHTADSKDLAKYITLVSAKGLCDYIVLPYFDLQNSSYQWPAEPEIIERTKSIAQGTVEFLDKKYKTFQTEHYTVIDLTNTHGSGRFEISSDTLKRNKALNNIINEKKSLGSSEAVECNQKNPIRAKINIPKKDDNIYIQLYSRTASNKSGKMDLVVIMKDENNNIVDKVKRQIAVETDYTKYESSIAIGNNVANIEIELAPVAINKYLIKSMTAQSFSSDELTIAKEEHVLSNLGYNNVKFADNVIVQGEEVFYLGNSSVIINDKSTKVGENIEIGMELYINNQQTYEDDARIINKWDDWQQNMSFLVEIKKDSIPIIFTQDGTNFDGIFLDKTSIQPDQWNKLRITFNKGTLKVYVNDILVGDKILTFNRMFVSNTDIVVGKQLQGKIRHFYYISD